MFGFSIKTKDLNEFPCATINTSFPSFTSLLIFYSHRGLILVTTSAKHYPLGRIFESISLYIGLWMGWALSVLSIRGGGLFVLLLQLAIVYYPYFYLA